MCSGMWFGEVSALALLLLVLGMLVAPSQAGISNVTVSPDEDALLAFKASIQNDPFRVLNDWVDGGLCKNWSHVECNANSRVITLDLKDSLLVAPAISTQLSRLSYLQNLNLQNNSFSGQIPSSLRELSSLQQLRLGLNPLTGDIPPELLTFDGLFYLNLARTGLSGSIPPSVSNLGNISFLYLDNTQLSGAIPPEIGLLPKLQILNLFQDFPRQASRLTGPLPESLANLTTLTLLNVANNDLSGELPASFTRLQMLTIMNVSGNHFTGEIPPGVLQLPSLKTLDVSSNNFLGTIAFPKSIQDFRYGNNPLLRVTDSCAEDCSSISKPRTKFPTVVVILLAIGLVVLVFGVLGCTLYCRKRAAAKKHQTLSQVKEPNEVTANVVQPPVHTRRFTLKEIMVATKNFDPQYVIGSGGFGLVYKGHLENNEVVAVKRATEASQQGMTEFFTEVELLSRIHHKHLVNLVGYCADSGEQMLIYEYVPNGSLLEHLIGQRGAPLTWRQRIRVAICAAHGLAYLHEGCSPPIIHRDLKPSNILLDSEDGAKVGDFGLSKEGPLAGHTHISTSVKGTPGYLDPYYYLSYHLSTSSDVYSFGVILLQLVSAKPAVDHSRKKSQYNIITWAKDSIAQGDIEAIMDSKLLRQEYNRDVLLHMATLGLRCVAKDHKSRPTMTQVSYELDIVLRTYDTTRVVKQLQPEEEKVPRMMAITSTEEGSGDLREQEKLKFRGDSSTATSLEDESQEVGLLLPGPDGYVTGSNREWSAAESTGTGTGTGGEVDPEEYRNLSSSGSVYVFPLDRADSSSNIKFDGMSWVDIKNMDDERLIQFSGAIAYERKLQEFTGNIEISGNLDTLYQQQKTRSAGPAHPMLKGGALGPKLPPKSSPL